MKSILCLEVKSIPEYSAAFAYLRESGFPWEPSVREASAVLGAGFPFFFAYNDKKDCIKIGSAGEVRDSFRGDKRDFANYRFGLLTTFAEDVTERQKNVELSFRDLEIGEKFIFEKGTILNIKSGETSYAGLNKIGFISEGVDLGSKVKRVNQVSISAAFEVRE